MTPLGGSLVGMSVVALDASINGFDLLMDPVGWGILAVMVGRLAGVRPAFRVASVASWLGALVTLPQLVGEVWGVLPEVVVVVLQTVVLVSMCTGMIAVIGTEHRSATGLNVIRWADVATTVAYVVLLPVAVHDPAVVIPLAVATVVVAVSFVVMTWNLRHHEGLSGSARLAHA
jgi:hypothetical protein